MGETKFTAREKMRAAQKEVGYRRYVYPRLIANGKLTQARADSQIALMEEIALEYGEKAVAEEAQGDLLKRAEV